MMHKSQGLHSSGKKLIFMLSTGSATAVYPSGQKPLSEFIAMPGYQARGKIRRRNEQNQVVPRYVELRVKQCLPYLYTIPFPLPGQGCGN
jgi:hypothetical protein